MTALVPESHLKAALIAATSTFILEVVDIKAPTCSNYFPFDSA